MADNRFLVPEGVDDIIVEECARKRITEQKLRQLFISCGYHEVYTPAFEYFDLFYHNREQFPQEDLIKFMDARGRVLVFRPDVTVPIARMVSTKMKNASFPLKVFYVMEVFRSGRSRASDELEFTQAGAEIIGVSGEKADAENIASAVEAMKAAGLENFRIEISHIDFLDGFLEESGFSDADSARVRELVSGRNIPALEEFLSAAGAGEAVAGYIMKIPFSAGSFEEIYENWQDCLLPEKSALALENLKKIMDILKDYGLEKNIGFDLSIASEFGYYSGVIFKGYTGNLGYILCSGGRYDRLFRDFNAEIPATGFALNVNDLDRALEKQARQESYRERYVYVRYGTDRDRKKALQTVRRLRSEGFYAELDIAGETEEEAVARIKERDISHFLSVTDGRLKFRDIRSGTSRVVSEEELVKMLSAYGEK